MAKSSISKRIAALLAKGGNSGASEAEAVAAMELAQKLMNTHGLTLDDVQGADGERVEIFDGEHVTGRMAQVNRYFIDPLRRFCHVSSYITTQRNGWTQHWVELCAKVGDGVIRRRV